jgi:predicted nucleic acid-binding protein
VILLDTNILIYASDRESRFGVWSRDLIAAAVAGEGAAMNAVGLAELCVGEAEPATAAERIRSWGVAILDVPVAAAEVCATAYRLYRERRRAETGKDAPPVPLPDFFIGAHAQVMRWELATVDAGRFKTYFPAVPLRMP